VFETRNWTNRENGKSQTVLTYTETDKKIAQKELDKDYKTGKREGTNETGLHWKEEWAVNEKTGHQRWSKMTHEPKHLRNDGFDAKWGEWREIFPGKEANGEKWTEMLKEEDDYWERRSEKYNDFPKPIVQDV